MKGSYKVIMEASLVMVASLAVVLGVVLVLLAELYCSLLHRRRQLQMSSSNTNPTTTTTIANANAAGNVSSQTQQLQGQSASPHQSLRSFYAHGVLLSAPRSFLFPAVHDKEGRVDIEKQQFRSQLRQFFESEARESNTPHRIGVVSASPPSPSFISVSSPRPIEIVTLHGGSTSEYNGEGCGCSDGENFVYISNPIYDNEVHRPSRADTPFETPGASPSHLGTGGSSGNARVGQSSPSGPSSLRNTPPLSPLKKLPVEAGSVALRDAGSLGTSGSGYNTNNGLSSSSSGSLCTSPSW